MPLFQLPPIEISKDVVLQPTLSARTRFESRNNRDFRGEAKDRKDDLYFRVRPGFTAKVGDRWSAAFEFQYAHTTTELPRDTERDDFRDATLAYVAYKDEKAKVTIGRQKIPLGSERLIGPLEWANVARSFDGLRIQSGNWDVFGFEVGVQQPRPVTAARYVGGSFQSRYGLTYAVHKSSRLKGVDTKHTTLTHHWTMSQGLWNYEAEGALQFGEVGPRDQEAWAVHLQAGRSLAPRTKAWVEFNAASGGASKGKNRTFDNLLPTNHKFYGSMDLMAWKNMNEVAAGVSHKTGKDGELKLHGHWFSLRDPRDAWYGASGAALRRDATGASGRDVGWEIDLEYAHQVDARNQIHAGIASFQPGKFVDRLTPGKADSQTWLYLSWSWKM